MNAPLLTQLGRLTAIAVGLSVFAAEGDHTCTVTVTGTGSVSATALWQGSNDGAGWVTLATLFAAGTGVGTAKAATTETYRYWRLNVTALTGDAVTGAVSSEESSSTSSAALVSGGGKPEADLIGDSIPRQGFSLPSASFGATTGRGSYYDASNVKQVGVMQVIPGNPTTLIWRAAHSLATGARTGCDGAPSNFPLVGSRLTHTVIDATTTTIPVDSTALAVAHTSAAQANDIMFSVDSSYGNAGWPSWMLFRLRNPYRALGSICRNGATTAEVLAAYRTNRPTTRKRRAYVHVARNEAVFDQASHDELAALVLLDYEEVRWIIPFMDATGGASAAQQTKNKSIAAWVRGKELTEQRFRGIDFFGAGSDSTLQYEATIATLLHPTDYTHTRANGGRVFGYAAAAAEKRDALNPVADSIALASSASNLLTGARFTGKTGTLGGIAEGDAPTGWQVGGTNHVAGGVVGIYTQVLSTPTVPWQPGLGVTKGQVIKAPGDDNWYAVKDITGNGKLSNIRPKATYDAAPLNDNSAVAPAAGLTLSASTTGTGRTVTADAAVFASTAVGKRIRMLDLSADGTTNGHATITGYTSSTVVTATVDIAFTVGTSITTGTWQLETTMSNGGTGFADGNATLYKIEPFTDSTQNLLWLWGDVQIGNDDGNRRVEFWQNIALPGSVVAGSSQIQGQLDLALMSRYRYACLRIKCLNGSTQVAATHGLGVNGTLTNAPYMGREDGVVPAPPVDVPAGTTNLQYEFHFAPGIEGGRFALCLPVMEPVT